MTEAPRDIDAAWRAASREEPPPALDDAIRAAARREVGAAPRRARATPAWWPLAAAATVAVVAIGIVQMTPPERLSAELTADVHPASVANQAGTNEPPAQTAANVESDRRVAASAPAEKPAGLRIPASALRKESPGENRLEEQGSAASRQRTDPARRAPAEQGLAMPVERESKQKLERANATAPATTSRSADASSAAPSRSVPFPAASPPRDKLDAQAQAAPAAPAAQSRQADGASPAQPVPPAASTAGTLASAAPAPAEKRMAMARPATGETPREADMPLRPADEWIKLMRRLIAEGKRGDAAKELAAFRTAYKERADPLLPADLREFKP